MYKCSSESYFLNESVELVHETGLKLELLMLNQGFHLAKLCELRYDISFNHLILFLRHPDTENKDPTFDSLIVM